MNFDISRLRRSDRIVGGSAIAFFIFLFFFHWYGISSNAPSIAGINTNVGFNGWRSFSNSRWIWLITIIVALVAVAVASGALNFKSPVHLHAIVAGLGALSSVLILYRIIHHPTASASIGSFHASAGIKIGIWLGLLAALGITYGGYLGMQEDDTSISDVREQASGAVSNLSGSSERAGEAAPAPDAPPIPPPAPDAPPIPPPAAAPAAPESSGDTPAQ